MRDRAAQGFIKFPNVAGLNVRAHYVRTREIGLDIVVGIAAILAAVIARILIETVAGGIAPFILTFPAAIAATLARGGRAGTIAAVGCQLLTIWFVFPHWQSSHGGLSTDLVNVVLSTVALGGTIWATASYRRTASLLRFQCQQQVDTLTLLMAEMDHRTKNNFQIAAGLLAHQAVSTFDASLAQQLELAGRRLETIASIYQDLSIRENTRENVDLAGHLQRIVALLREGATPSHIFLRFKAEPVELPVQTAIIVGLIVNEWVTNALKHAFGDGPGRVDVELLTRGRDIEVVVRDDGDGRRDDHGRGSAVVASLAEVIGGEILISVRLGTRCSLKFKRSP